MFVPSQSWQNDHFYIKMPPAHSIVKTEHVCQDRLGTNIGKSWETRRLFSAAGGVAGMTTYQALVTLGPSSRNIYTIYGQGQAHPIIMPAAFQVGLPACSSSQVFVWKTIISRPTTKS
jgi:hypothetical protein